MAVALGALRSLRRLRKTGGYALRAESAPACLGTEAVQDRGNGENAGKIHGGFSIAMFEYRIIRLAMEHGITSPNIVRI